MIFAAALVWQSAISNRFACIKHSQELCEILLRYHDIYGDSRPNCTEFGSGLQALVLARHYVLEAEIWTPLPVCGAPQYFLPDF